MDPDFLPESVPQEQMPCGQNCLGRDEEHSFAAGPARTGTESLRMSESAGIPVKLLPHG